MKLPSFEIERSTADGNFYVGIDEAGRGPLAGPVVAAAVWVDPRIFKKKFKEIKLIRDSKTLSEKQRILAHEYIQGSEDFVVGIGEVSHSIIDRINILNATLLAMKIAAEEIKNQKSKIKMAIQNSNLSKIAVDNDFCYLIDGNKRIPKIKEKQRLFAAGDARIFSIAAASICAKVYRDNLMRGFHEKYPEYGFDRHKGYGTQLHVQALKKFGPCDIHRKSFAPVKDYVKNQSRALGTKVKSIN